MPDSSQLRRIVVSAINGVQYDQSRYLTYWWNLDPQNQVVFFQFYLAKGLIYRHFVSVESEALFWLLQNVLYDFTGDYRVYANVHGGIISTWLMNIVPSGEHINFKFDSIGVEHREILKKYDNVKRVGFSSRISREMGWDENE
jgi:hypothetical protein